MALSGRSANKLEMTIKRFAPSRELIIPPATPPNAAASENADNVQPINVESYETSCEWTNHNGMALVNVTNATLERMPVRASKPTGPAPIEKIVFATWAGATRAYL